MDIMLAMPENARNTIDRRKKKTKKEKDIEIQDGKKEAKPKIKQMPALHYWL